MYKNGVKIGLDIAGALLIIVLLSPCWLLLTLILLVVNSGKPFFIQARPGLHGKIFRVIKFRTMNGCVDENGNLLPDSERITAVGAFLRKTSLDEIPQVLNVLSGDMSFVGPRPLLVEYLPLYNAEQSRRHEVRPGITGWAQVNGRNTISWQQKFAYDVWYVDHLSFRLDMRILWMTLGRVFREEGRSEAAAGMEKFTGN